MTHKVFVIIFCLFFLIFNSYSKNNGFTLAGDKEKPKIILNAEEEEVVQTAISLLIKDIHSISSVELSVLPDHIQSIKGNIIAGTIGVSNCITHLEESGLINISEIRGKWEAFYLKTIDWQGKKTLVIAGSDSRGTAFGIMEISRLIGVSPWHFWADVPIPERKKIILQNLDVISQPSVQYRGIFINDEDWGLLPWASKTYDPEAGKGVISPKVHELIFELLLRLRANTFWPAMHECSVPFYLIPGNKEAAKKYGIFIGTSHCEPMSCNVNGEWKVRGKGNYNYVNNADKVQEFLEERVKETADYDNIYTLGMRGIHDGAMDGAKTPEEQKKVLDKIIKDQRVMLSKWKKENIENIPQAFIPYKEVLDVYNQGLKVPEDVTLIWCDDNYGYIRHFPNDEEKLRKGGNGIYYHISYWGRPHDYLWLATTHPALIYNQMATAYDSGIQKMWIVNVGDIKPGEYLTEFFLDMAWDIEQIKKSGINNHLKNWLSNTFDHNLTDQLSLIMNEYYRLAYIRKPEFMGNTRVEERDPAYSVVKDLPWNENEIKLRLSQYDTIASKVKTLSELIPINKKNAWFQLIEYPVLAANEMNKKHLYAQLARHNLGNWKSSETAYDSIISLTNTYNSLNNGKWKYMMDFQPRKLAVFQAAPKQIGSPLALNKKNLARFNGTEYTSSEGNISWANGLGYEEKAVTINKGSSLTFEFESKNKESITAEIRLLPNHPVNSDHLRVLISIDNGLAEIPVSYETKGRSEEWKINVLGNQAIKRLILPLRQTTIHQLKITALDEGIVLDQVIIE